MNMRQALTATGPLERFSGEIPYRIAIALAVALLLLTIL
jgi:hypothetical protein